MAIYHEDIVNIDLESGTIHRSFLNHAIGYGDDDANRFGIRAYRNGVAEDLGGTCAGYFIRADGGTVVISDGVVSGNMAYVTLPEACYAVEGNFSLAIKVSGSGVTGTMRIVDGVVSRTSTSATVDPGTVIESIEDLIDAIDDAVASIPEDYSGLWTSLAPAYSTSATYPKTGTYCTYDGGLYRSRVPITSAESWTAAHWEEVDLGAGILQAKELKRRYSEDLNTGIADGMIPLDFRTTVGGFGGTSGTTYTETTATARTRWTAFVPVTKFTKMSFKLDDYTTWRYYVIGVDSDNKIVYTTGWKTADLTIEPADLNGAINVRMMMTKVNETNFNASEEIWDHATVLYRPAKSGFISFRRAVVSGEDLDNLTEPGVYYYPTSVHPTHEPFSTGAVILVYGAGTSTALVQVGIGYGTDVDSSHRVAHREKTSGSFSAWRELTQKTSLAGKTFSVLGDSISSFQGYVPEGYAYHYPAGSVQAVGDMWWGKLAAETGMTLDVNNSYSGSPLCETGSLTERPRGASAERMANLGTSPDYIIVFMGTNDFNQEAAVGTYKIGDTFPDNINNFRNALAVAMNGIQANYPNAKLLVCNVPECYPARLADTATASPFWTNSTTGTIANLNNAIDEICKEFGAEVVDLRRIYTPKTRSSWTHDGSAPAGKNYTFGVHPNAGGMTRIKDEVLKHL